MLNVLIYVKAFAMNFVDVSNLMLYAVFLTFLV